MIEWPIIVSSLKMISKEYRAFWPVASKKVQKNDHIYDDTPKISHMLFAMFAITEISFYFVLSFIILIIIE
jgi:hypothetical protein